MRLACSVMINIGDFMSHVAFHLEENICSHVLLNPVLVVWKAVACFVHLAEGVFLVAFGGCFVSRTNNFSGSDVLGVCVVLRALPYGARAELLQCLFLFFLQCVCTCLLGGGFWCTGGPRIWTCWGQFRRGRGSLVVNFCGKMGGRV